MQDEGGNSVEQLYNVTQSLVREGNSRKDLSGLFSAFTANDPQFVVKIDRAKARSLQVPIQQISDALQVYMGSSYVNDFDFNNRAYRVYVQADQGFPPPAARYPAVLCALRQQRRWSRWTMW